MNEIRRQRLQNQIFRHIATYYQKMSGTRMLSQGHDARGSAAGTTPSELTTMGHEVPGSAAGTDQPLAIAGGKPSPFSAPTPFDTAHDITQHISDYCTFTRCELSPDGSFAKIFVSIWGSAAEQERIMKNIRRLIHGMRQSIAKHIRMRTIPHLEFVQDHSFERGAQIDKLIN